MSKTITLRLKDDVYELLKKASEGEHRTISNYIEFAALNYVRNEIFNSDKELSDLKFLYPSLHNGLKQAKEGKYTIMDNVLLK